MTSMPVFTTAGCTGGVVHAKACLPALWLGGDGVYPANSRAPLWLHKLLSTSQGIARETLLISDDPHPHRFLPNA